MPLQFQPPNVPRGKSKEEALYEPIGETIRTLPQQYMAYKLQKQQQQNELAKASRQEELDKMNHAMQLLDAQMKLLKAQQGHTIINPVSGQRTDVSGLSKDIGIVTEGGVPRLNIPETATPGSRSTKVLADTSPKPPPGFRFNASGGLDPIPGGPAARKIEGEEKKEEFKKTQEIGKAERVIAKVDQALDKVNVFTTGVGGLLRVIPGTSAKNLDKDIDTIKANIGFAELNAMRAASPTGGALGQVAIRELDFLQAAIASLDTEQSPKQVRERLKEVKTHYENWKAAMEGKTSEGENSGTKGKADPTGYVIGNKYKMNDGSMRTYTGNGEFE